jgi:hypothetical protein
VEDQFVEQFAGLGVDDGPAPRLSSEADDAARKAAVHAESGARRLSREIDMTDKTLVLGFYPNEEAADAAAAELRASGAADYEAIGVLALDADGALKEDKVGARSIGKGAGVGLALALLGPVGIGAGVVGGVAGGALFHKGLKLKDSDRARITSELTQGKAAVGVLSRPIDVPSVSAVLTHSGAILESHDLSYEDPPEGQEPSGPTS